MIQSAIDEEEAKVDGDEAPAEKETVSIKYIRDADPRCI